MEKLVLLQPDINNDLHSYITHDLHSYITNVLHSYIINDFQSCISIMIYSPISREIYVFGECSLALRRDRRVLSCVRRARRMLSVVAAGSAVVNGMMVVASEGGWRRKLVYMAQRLFVAGASHPPTYANPTGE